MLLIAMLLDAMLLIAILLIVVLLIPLVTTSIELDGVWWGTAGGQCCLKPISFLFRHQDTIADV